MRNEEIEAICRLLPGIYTSLTDFEIRNAMSKKFGVDYNSDPAEAELIIKQTSDVLKGKKFGGVYPKEITLELAQAIWETNTEEKIFDTFKETEKYLDGHPEFADIDEYFPKSFENTGIYKLVDELAKKGNTQAKRLVFDIKINAEKSAERG